MMKIKVKAPFFDENGIHKVGEICEVKNFRPELMEAVEEKKAENADLFSEETIEAKKEKIEKAVKETKTTKRKKG